MRTLLTCCLAALLAPAAASSPEEILARMTPAEKAGQMIIVYNSDAAFLRKNGVGGVILFQNMVKDRDILKKELAGKQAAQKVPLLVCIDQEGGKINRMKNLSGYADAPSARAMAAMPDRAITDYARKITADMTGIGINTNFAPCLDPSHAWQDSQTYMDVRDRSFGRDPAVITAKAGAFLTGAKAENGLCFLKHFPGYDATGNSDQKITRSTASPDDIGRYMAPFKDVIGQAAGVMMSNIVYTRLDSIPAVLSPKVVALGRKIAGDKLIITDDLWAVSIREVFHPINGDFKADIPDAKFMELVKAAVRAGNDMLLITYTKKVPLMVRAITGLIVTDKTAAAIVDRAVLRILKLKSRLE